MVVNSENLEDKCMNAFQICQLKDGHISILSRNMIPGGQTDDPILK